MNLKNIREFIWQNKYYILLFLIITSFFLYQKITLLSWDFASYVLNAKYWFGQGTYFEPMRPPLMPLLLGILSIFGWKASEYIFIILTSALFASAVYMFAKQQKWQPELLYALFVTPYFLRLALMNGTELLSLTLLLLSIVYIRKENTLGGMSLGLTALARYTYLLFFPIVLLHKKIKHMIYSLLLFAVPIALWFSFNFFTTGNFFTSIADQYANVVLFRQEIMMPFNYKDVLLTTSYLLPTTIIGLLLSFWSMIRTKKDFWQQQKLNITMILFLAYTLWAYSGIALKDERFLFLMILPIAYFSYIALTKIIEVVHIKKKHKRQATLALAGIIVIITTILFVIMISKYPYYNGSHYYQTLDILEEQNMSQCAISSNEWVPLAYIGRWAEPFPEQDQLQTYIDRGSLIILYKYSYEPAYMLNDTFLETQPLLYNDSRLIIIGTENCSEEQPVYDEPFVKHKQKLFEKRFDVTTNTNPCLIFFHDKPLLEKTCNLVNGNGFNQDTNRVYLP